MIKKLYSITLALLCFLVAQTSFASVPTLAVTFDTNVYIYNGTSSQKSKIYSAEQKIRDVIASESFRTKVLNHTYGGAKRFVDSGGLTNSQIYYKILHGIERLNGIDDNEMDLKIKTYYESSNTVGYTSSSSSYINMNTKFLNQYTSNQVARNMTHEWLHKLGFHHAVNYSYSRDFSVPYAIGKIVEELARYH
ncbi:MAG TPA: hypothetical protein VNJ08_01045 [Bacteriovoracaceae bacterium]|nr:hypothetical protein [Bacteriovoracaceae bacterium]